MTNAAIPPMAATKAADARTVDVDGGRAADDPGLHISRAVYGASKLGISDLLADGPRPSAELAQLTKAHAPSLYRVLRLPAALNLLWGAAAGAICAHPARGAAADRRSGIPSQLGDVDRTTRRTAAFRSHPIFRRLPHHPCSDPAPDALWRPRFGHRVRSGAIPSQRFLPRRSANR
jgi:hypothetical protein